MLSIKTELEAAIKKFESALNKEELGKGIARALNKTIAGVRTDVVKDVRKVYKLKAGDVRKTLNLYKANATRQEANMVSKDARLGLYKFAAKQNKRGTSAAIKDSRKTIAHAFIATMKNGHVGVFIRTDKRDANNRQIIEEIDSISIPYALNNESVAQTIYTSVSNRLANNLEHELSYILSKKN